MGFYFMFHIKTLTMYGNDDNINDIKIEQGLHFEQL